MRIVIDARPAEKEGFGIARYVYELLRGLKDIDMVNDYILLVNTNKLADLLAGGNFSLFKINSKWMSFQEQFEVPRILWKLRPDVFHATSFVVPYILPCKTIISLLDVIHMAFPKDYSWFHRFYYRVVVRNAAKKARAIITISEYSKKQIIEYFGLLDEKIKVTYLSSSSGFYLLKKINEGQPYPYILTVGSPKPHKNVLNLIKAYCIVKEKYGLIHKLMIVGGINPAAENEITAHKLGDQVVLKYKLSDSEMNKLYNAADVFVFPSLCEGFGLPVIEAMACGVPVISSNASSLPEVVGEAGIMVDPSDEKALAEAMRKVLSDPALARSMREKGLERSKEFSWTKCASETLALYQSAFRANAAPTSH